MQIVTILILVDGFLQSKEDKSIYYPLDIVTILILVDGFLQFQDFSNFNVNKEMSHNPYFSRWFSAILVTM